MSVHSILSQISNNIVFQAETVSSLARMPSFRSPSQGTSSGFSSTRRRIDRRAVKISLAKRKLGTLVQEDAVLARISRIIDDAVKVYVNIRHLYYFVNNKSLSLIMYISEYIQYSLHTDICTQNFIATTLLENATFRLPDERSNFGILFT